LLSCTRQFLAAAGAAAEADAGAVATSRPLAKPPTTTASLVATMTRREVLIVT
jgi:hypothetical protein